MTDVKPGDVLLVRVPARSIWTKLASEAIRLGAEMHHEPTTWTHVIVADHYDKAGNFWGMQGQPGTVGPVDLAPYLSDPVTLTNVAQPKTDAQRDLIVAAMAPLVLKAEYDWAAIGVDAAIAIAAAEHVAPLWGEVGKQFDHWGAGVPGHVVCSSLADYAYTRAGLASPSGAHFVSPADWAVFIEAGQW